MSGSLEVRKFLLQHDSASGGAGYGAGVPAQRTGEAPRVTNEQVRKARLAVARSATGVADCRELLEMLGLIPGEDGIPPVIK